MREESWPAGCRRYPLEKLFARGAFEALAIENADLSALNSDDACLAQLAEGSGGGFTIDAQMIGQFLVGGVAHTIPIGSFEKKRGQARQQGPERHAFQVHQDMHETPPDQVEQSPGHLWKIPQQRIERFARNNAHERRLGSLGAAVIGALANATHLAEDFGRGKLADDQFSFSQVAKGLHASFFEQVQFLLFSTKLKENVPGWKFLNCGFLLQPSQTRSG